MFSRKRLSGSGKNASVQPARLIFGWGGGRAPHIWDVAGVQKASLQLGELIFSEDTTAPVLERSVLNCPGVLGGDMQDEMKEDLSLLKPQMCRCPRCLQTRWGDNRKSCDAWECEGSLFPTQGAELDGALGLNVTDGVNVWEGVGLGLAGPARAHTVLLLTEQGAGLPRPAVWPVSGRGLLQLEGEGGSLRRWGNVGACWGARRRRRGLGERGGVAGGARRLRQRLAGSAGGRGGHLRNRGAAARRRGVRHLAPRGRGGQQQGVAGPWWRHGRQRHRRVQAGAAALWRLRRAVQFGRQETVLVLSTSDLRGENSGATVQIMGSSGNI